MRNSKFLIAITLLMSCVFGFACQSGSQSTPPGGTGAGTSLETDRIKTEPVSGGGALREEKKDPLAEFAAFYKLDPPMVATKANQANFDPNNFNSQDPIHWSNFFTFIHGTLPGLSKVWEAAYASTAAALFGMINAIQNPVADPTAAAFLSSYFQNWGFLMDSWKGKVLGAGEVLGLTVPFFTPTPANIPANVQPQIDETINKIDINFTALTDEETALIRSIFVSSLFGSDWLFVGNQILDIDSNSQSGGPFDLIFEIDPI